MTREELSRVLDLHKKWLNGERDGERADLTGADLRFVDLSGVNLAEITLICANVIGADVNGTILTGADLRGADLNGVNLQGANIERADLRQAILTGANLTGASLRWANLTGAILLGTNLEGVNLEGANLYGASLRWANLTGAILLGTNLEGVNLEGANLYGANLIGVKYNARTSFMALQCPEEGAFIAYKKVGRVIIKLEVPEDAKRSSATTRKCRCSKARVLGFYDLDGRELDIEEVVNHNYVTTIYRKGVEVFPDSWDDDRWNECSNGIHFFMTFDEAKNY